MRINYFSTDGGSTVIQHRVDGSVDFDQTWEKYEFGFGDLESKWTTYLKHTNPTEFEDQTRKLKSRQKAAQE